MREYAKIAPQFWNGKTGKALKAKGPEAVVVALYLLTCPHANMLGLYYVSKTYIAVDTGLGLEGASKGLQWACEAGFCAYDEDTEVVWVKEMAAYQIADRLEAKDLRCKGVQKEYDSLPENPYLRGFYEKYATAFNMTSCRDSGAELVSPLQAPSKPLRSQEQEQEQEQELKEPTVLVSDKSPTQAEPIAVDRVDCPMQAIADVWNSTALSMPAVNPVAEWPDARRKAVKARWVDKLKLRKYTDRATGLDYWSRLFDRVESSDFLTGRNGGTFSATLDWVMNPTNLAKIIENGYPNREALAA